VAAFLRGEFKEKVGNLSVRVTKESENTGEGMSYKNRLVIKRSNTVIYDTGMITYRHGRSGQPTNYDLSYGQAGLLVRGAAILLGIRTGTDKVKIIDIEKGSEIASYDVGQAKRDKASSSLDPNDLEDVRGHFINRYNHGNQYPWKLDRESFECDLGSGFIACHNGMCGRGGEIWDKCVVVLRHKRDGKIYISDPVYIELSGNNWCLSHLVDLKISGPKFKCGFVCCHYDCRPHSCRPTFVEFELENV
jgi:hypothetical protein